MLGELEIAQIKSHMQIIYRYLLKLGASKEDAEDIVQDTLIKTIEYLDGLKVDNLNAWQFKVAINRYYDLLRKRKHVHLQSENHEQLIEQLCDMRFQPEDHLISSELNQSINNGLFQLNDSYRTLLIMKYWLELSYREIADQLDISESQVKTYLYRARLAFKKIWEENSG